VPVDENLHSATGDPLDRESETFTKGPNPLPLYVGDLRQDSSGAGGAGAGVLDYNRGFLGTDANVPILTAVSFATGAGATKTFTATFTKGTGVAKACVYVYDDTTKQFLAKADITATGTVTISTLVAATQYTIYIRAIATDGRIGSLQGPSAVTTHA
jgi:hypothetical protein